MAICPFADWKPVLNHGGAVKAHQGLVVHVQQGCNSTWGQDNNPATAVSNTFWCAKDGTLQQMVDTDVEAWTEMAGNAFYSSVETEGYDYEPLTQAQVDMIGKLFAWGHGVHGWPLQTCDHGGNGLTTHAHYPSGEGDEAWGGHLCPGAKRSPQIPAVLDIAIKIVGTAPVLPNPPVVLPAGTDGVPAPAWHGVAFTYPPVISNNDVHDWQYRMVQRGRDLVIDGNYGPASKAACEAFQEEFSLTVDGVVGPVTWAATWTEKIL